MRMITLLGWAGAAMAAPAHSAVMATSDVGFVIESEVEIAADADAVYALLLTPGRWWNDAHSYSGDSANMTIDAHAGGCFCETIPAKAGAAGSVEHGRVIYVVPGRQLRLSGALGPLQTDAAIGTLDLVLTPAGKGMTVRMTYVAGGYLRTRPAQIAPMVDQVLGEQLQGLKRVAETPPS
ncbi:MULTISPECIES: SRPBCC family protein [Sphingobium]|uniref:ATPase n=1 Tax=Sphingobium cupriresistens TaxID=1132417 RepID=A0A8G2DWP6_9SPHN|nr:MULTISPECIES: SRPBCC family protein [Sphingobium]MBJ7378034.1 SRPBCC family protein [Sphingobium sp.]RYM08432.1 ATPase [Sphingobium cupriresistens]